MLPELLAAAAPCDLPLRLAWVRSERPRVVGSECRCQGLGPAAALRGSDGCLNICFSGNPVLGELLFILGVSLALVNSNPRQMFLSIPSLKVVVLSTEELTTGEIKGVSLNLQASCPLSSTAL